jgi:putative ABC transport system permease protein
MLQIRDVCKQYKTGDLVQKALDHVSLNLRDNEFVAVLGPSGSGKSTLLNIIGGLDRYDSGDLIIDGISTKKYKDRDWDSYRNHTIGFIFQSYNLIPHQTVLANVELALTISGISGSEKRQRAEEALRKVGLGDQMHKKPNQMSGGQMQRVAIARALVNDPQILLADEPTGALDTETSVQVMDLLKEVAKDRLVVMVTHNPDLAYEYATRIVKLKDGRITDDSDPCEIREDEEAHHENMGKSSMSFLTALSLSFNNLLTKKARTILVSFAGSIGIIGIALIMSLSNGVNAYIKHTEEDTLSEYPLEIQSQGFDLSSMLGSGSLISKPEESGEVTERAVVNDMFSKMTSNDLASLKQYLESGKSGIEEYSRSIEYQYNVSPLIFREEGDSVIQVNPDKAMASSGIAPTSSVYSSAFSMDIFSSLPEEEDLYIDGYEVKAGHWPENENEVVVVLNGDGEMTDMVSYTLGLRDYAKLEKIIQDFTNGKSASKDTDDEQTVTYSYDDLLGRTFKLVNAADTYTYDSSLKVWTDRSSDSAFMKDLVSKGEDLTVVGVVQPTADTDIAMLNPGISYSPQLTDHIIEKAAGSEAVQAQLASRDINIFTGKPFGEQSGEDLDLSSLISVDTSKMKDAFSFDPARLNIDPSALNLSGALSLVSLPEISGDDLQKILSKGLSGIDFTGVDLQKTASDVLASFLQEHPEYAGIQDGLRGYLTSQDSDGAAAAVSTYFKKAGITKDTLAKIRETVPQIVEGYVKQLDVQNLPDDIVNDFRTYLDAHPEEKEKITGVLSSIELSEDENRCLLKAILDGYDAYAEKHSTLSISQMQKDLKEFLENGNASSIILKDLGEGIDLEKLQNQMSEAVSEQMKGYTASMADSLGGALTDSIQQAMTSMAEQLPSAFSINPEMLVSAFSMNMDSEQLQQTMASMMSGNTSSYQSNLSSLGYADPQKPDEIVIYPKDFEAKNEVKTILDDYNRQMQESDQENKVIIYTDMVGTLMSSVTEIINVISWILIAFVAISLVVSSIMIGVITYISVLERRKEIGILRAIGASKHNVSEVFNAETFITGLLAGLIGVLIAVLLLIPGNYLIHLVTGRQEIHASLPLTSAVSLILLSIFLTLLGGFIPAKKAAKSDPVKALRTE